MTYDLLETFQCLYVYNMLLYISARDHARKLKLSSYVHRPFINKMFSISLCLSDSVWCRIGYYFLAKVPYFSFGAY